MVSASRTISHPVFVCQVVSRTSVPGRYRRPAGTVTSAGPSRKPPAERSSMAPNRLGLSGRGRHIHSTFPLGATRATDSRSDRKAYSAIGGKGLRANVEAAPSPVRPRAWGRSGSSDAFVSSVGVSGL